MDSSCEKIQGQLADYILGILNDEEIYSINQHINRCPGCRQYMLALENENRILMQFGKDLDTTMTARQNRAIEALSGSSSTSHKGDISVWRTIMKNRITTYAATAAIILVIVIGIIELGKPAGGASVALATAIDRVRQARTFSCTETFQMTYQDGDKHGTFLMKQKWMFKEPDIERHERLTSPWPRYIGEVTIMDYGTRQQLELRPVEKTATLSDMSSDYTIDEKTGELKLTQLDTSLRDRLLKLSAGAVEDFGVVELDGQSVQMLQSHQDNRIVTVWIDPVTYYPVQIELKWTEENRSPVMYSSIQIDVELDDALFSLEPPEGYTVKLFDPGWSDDKKKMSTKMMHLGLWCWSYASDNDYQFPGELADIVRANIIADKVLKRILASPDDPDGPPVIQYCKPDKDADRSTEVILYEIFDQWPEDGVVVCFADGHSELVADQNRFEELMK